MRRQLQRAALCLLPLTWIACGHESPPPASENHVFFQSEQQPADAGLAFFEQAYPPLDYVAPGGDKYKGVLVLGGTVRFSRPAAWKVRRASLAPEHRYIEYLSPKGYLFAVYERLDDPGSPWRDVLTHYEDDIKAKGGEVTGGAVPVAGRNTQGRKYVVRRTVKGQRAPYVNWCDEVLLRGKTRVDLVQVVHEGDSLRPIGEELLRVADTIEVL
jgi:hypothetical protein